MFKNYFKDYLVYSKDCWRHPIGATKNFYSRKSNMLIAGLFTVAAIGAEYAIYKIEEKKQEKKHKELVEQLKGTNFIVI